MADTTNRLAGIAYIACDGITVMVGGKFGYSVSKVKRETMSGGSGVQGYKETFIPGFITAEIRDSGALTVADFNDQTNVTVTMELANGKTIIGSGLWAVDSQEVDSMEATFTVKWEGPSVTEN